MDAFAKEKVALETKNGVAEADKTQDVAEMKRIRQDGCKKLEL
jgi:hypothetical protein